MITIKIIQTEHLCRSVFEPCNSNCFLGISKLSSNLILFFYTNVYLEFDLDKWSIVKFKKHSTSVLDAFKNETCQFVPLSEAEIYLICTNQIYQYFHGQNKKNIRPVNSAQNSILLSLKDKYKFTYQSIDHTFIFSETKLFKCLTVSNSIVDQCEKHSINFLTFYHLKETKAIFVTNDKIIYFGNDYLFFIKLNLDPNQFKRTTHHYETTQKIQTSTIGNIIEDLYIVEDFKNDQEIVQKPKDQNKLKSTKSVDKNLKSTKVKSNQITIDLIDQLLFEISKNQKLIKRWFYKDLFGCTIIEFKSSYRLPLNKNLTDYHSNNKNLTYDLFRPILTCYFSLFLFLIFIFLFTRLLNSSLINSIGQTLFKKMLTDKDRLFLQLRTEIENGVLRKLEQAELSKDSSYSKSEIRILIDTLLHEQLFVNSLNLDALKSIDLIRHLINDVFETIKNRQKINDKSTEKQKNKNSTNFDTFFNKKQQNSNRSNNRISNKLIDQNRPEPKGNSNIRTNNRKKDDL